MKLDRREELKAKKQAYVQDEILASAVTLFAARGFRAVTIDDIASNLGYTKSVVYYYFRSKSEILWQVFSRNYDTYFESITAISQAELEPIDALARIIRAHAINVMERHEWTAIYHRDESELTEKQKKLILGRKREYDAAIERVYQAGVDTGAIRDDIPTAVAVRAILGCCNWLYTWYKQDGPLSPQAIADHYVSLLMEGYALPSKLQKAARSKPSAKTANA
ncbi:TetR family transcriptional regulator [Paraburkholderia sp. BL27I4N3]|uniref:TetR/AcrR family transcriptional regulator n=1 Tax=Paraburkholderia sp. BL27I4N3 TaxID=1938805 RepID=UPI000E3B32DF|nr:TetR/AcrR family transcriptional regulator [Paraburkholderia sp. BL27I4N3]REE18159.1 TetR family transcriptional regulator [Paraburkholderia sp. BL27I4N3]